MLTVVLVACVGGSQLVADDEVGDTGTAATEATGDTGDTGDTGIVPPPTITSYGTACDLDGSPAGEGLATITAEIVGAGSALLFLGGVPAGGVGYPPPSRIDPIFEQHDLEVSATGVSIDLVTDRWSYPYSYAIPNVSTAFYCDQFYTLAHTGPEGADLSIAIRVEDADGAFLDCVAWGSDPVGVFDPTRYTDAPALDGCHIE
jgi:hypothetical protein